MLISMAAIKHHITVVVAVISISIAGLIAYFQLPRESMPDVEIPFVVITTPY